jgi:hypothetical protein
MFNRYLVFIELKRIVIFWNLGLPYKAFASCSAANETALGLKDLVENQLGEFLVSSATLIFTYLNFEKLKQLYVVIENTGFDLYLRKHFFQHPINAFFSVSCNPVHITIC